MFMITQVSLYVCVYNFEKKESIISIAAQHKTRSASV